MAEGVHVGSLCLLHMNVHVPAEIILFRTILNIYSFVAMKSLDFIIFTP